MKTPVNCKLSEHIKSIKYDAENKELHVAFGSATGYYYPIEPAFVNQLEQSTDTVGKLVATLRKAPGVSWTLT